MPQGNSSHRLWAGRHHNVLAFMIRRAKGRGGDRHHRDTGAGGAKNKKTCKKKLTERVGISTLELQRGKWREGGGWQHWLQVATAAVNTGAGGSHHSCQCWGWVSRLVLPDRELMKGGSAITSGCQQRARAMKL